MADVLVGAKQQAEKIIMEPLNGYNFAKQYVAMSNLLTSLGRKKEELAASKRHIREVCVYLFPFLLSLQLFNVCVHIIVKRRLIVQFTVE